MLYTIFTRMWLIYERCYYRKEGINTLIRFNILKYQNSSFFQRFCTIIFLKQLTYFVSRLHSWSRSIFITIKWCNHKINKQVHIDRQIKCSCIIETGKNLIVWQWIYRFCCFCKRSSWKKKAYLYKYQLPAFGKSRKLFVFGCISLWQ